MTIAKCKIPNGGLCNHLLGGNSVTFNDGTNFKIHETIKCGDKSFIYVTKETAGKNILVKLVTLCQKVRVHNQQICDHRTRKH